MGVRTQRLAEDVALGTGTGMLCGLAGMPFVLDGPDVVMVQCALAPEGLNGRSEVLDEKVAVISFPRVLKKPPPVSLVDSWL